MEGTVLLQTAELMFKLLGPPLFKKIKSISQNEEQIKILRETVEFIGDVLSDVEDKQFKEASVKNGYKRLRDAFLDADDFLDRVMSLKKEGEADSSGKFKKALRFFSRSNQAKCDVEVHSAIKEIKKKLDAIAQDFQKFGLKEPRIISEATYMTARATGSYVDVTEIVGREEDKRKIVDLFLRSSVDQKKIQVTSIVGIGGMGKTTTAQLVYDDKSWQESCGFDMKLWVSDSKKLNVKSLLKIILKSLSPNDNNLDALDEDHLRDRIVTEIRGKRFLLVLDDMESEDLWNWERLEALLNYGNKESRILVTTRSRKVASIVGSSNSTYQLKGLSDKDSFELFERYAFAGRTDEDLVSIGKLIVEKCVGVPLAVKVIGALLRGEEKLKWERVRDKGYSDITDENNQLMPIVKISYHDLDSTLKQCFSYCSLFPKNGRISKEILSNIWMANVRLIARKGETLEDVCDETFKILYNRCFLEVVEGYSSDGDDTYFKMHDLMHDLAKEVAGEEKLLIDFDDKVDLKNLINKDNVRHLNLRLQTKNILTPTFQLKGRRLRTFLGYCSFDCIKPFTFNKLVSGCPVLRYLDLRSCGIDILTNSIGMLIHLRHLDLSSNRFRTLPGSIAKLINLRYLMLEYCESLTHMPSGIEKLINLNHLKLAGCGALTDLLFRIGALTSLKVLDISWCSTLRELPMGIEKLTSIKDLKFEVCLSLTKMPSGMGALIPVCKPHRFIVGHTKSKQTAQLEELDSVSDLPQGELIIDLPNNFKLKETEGYVQTILLNNKCLRKLQIKWKKYNPGEEILGSHMIDILEKLQPPPHLEELKLQNYQAMEFPAWVPKDDFASVLPNLETILIRGCRKCKHLPPISRLPRLKYMELRVLDSLECIEENVSAVLFCPSLEKLSLQGLPELKGWCKGGLSSTNGIIEQEQPLMLPSFPHLLELGVYDCPMLMVAPILVSIVKAFSVNRHVEEELSEKTEETLSSSVSLLEQVCRKGGGFFLSMEMIEEIYQRPLALKISRLNASDIPSIQMFEAFREMSKHLITLKISSCSGLKTLPGLQYLTALQVLEIKSCCDFTWEEEDEDEKQIQSTSFQSLKMGGSTSLEASCSQDGEIPQKGLQSLERLTLHCLLSNLG